MIDTVNHYIEDKTFGPALRSIHKTMKNRSHVVHPKHWQGTDVSKKLEFRSHELLNVTLHIVQLSSSLEVHQADIAPNLPWADDHFEERVGGHPLNPGVQWANWPWATSADKFRTEEIFNHTYMERYWPRYAGMTAGGVLEEGESIANPLRGIRAEYGDMLSVVDLLCKDPLTRQAWIPIFFPEDTGVGDGGRKPCTLGYQFIVREDKLHTYYPLRSCDLIRHMRDDIYLTVRLALWILEKCHERGHLKDVTLGSYTMHMTSLHVFENDMRAL